MKKFWILVGVLVMCLVAVCVASTLTLKQLSLEGIDTLYVEVLLTENPIVGALSESQVRTDVELKLRRNGFKVVSLQDYEDGPLMPVLKISITSIPITDVYKANQTYAIASYIDVSLSQYVRLLKTNKLILGDTWDSGYLATVVPREYPQNTRSIVSDKIDEFMNDYLAANPKEQPAKSEVKKHDIFDQIENNTKP